MYGNVPRKVDQLLRSGTQVRLIVVLPEKDVTYHGPPIPIAMPDWQKKVATEMMAVETGLILQAYGEQAGFAVVNRESFKDLLGEFELQGSAAFDQQATSPVGRMVGANTMWSNVAGNRYRDIRTNRLIDLERNTILVLDEVAEDHAVDTATQDATLLESRLDGRRYVFDPASRRSYYVE